MNTEIKKLEALINEAEAALSLEKTSAEFQRKADEAGMAPDQYEKFQQISLECNLQRLNELQPTKTQTSNAKNGSARKEQKSSKMTFLNFLNRFRK